MTEKPSELSCPYCGGTRIIKKGFANRKNGRLQVFGCKDCKRRFLGRRRKGENTIFPRTWLRRI